MTSRRDGAAAGRGWLVLKAAAGRSVQALLLLLLAVKLVRASDGCAAAAGAALGTGSTLELFQSDAASITRLNFSQLPGTVYNSNDTSWLLLLYSPFGGYSLDYAPEFSGFARLAARWTHTVRLAAVSTGHVENLAAMHFYGARGLPALYFIPRRSTWGVTKARPMPRDAEFLEHVLLSELEKFVPSLKPVTSVTRLLRSSRAELVLYLEEAADGELSRRAVLDRRHLSGSISIGWRSSPKLPPGRLRVSGYRRWRRGSGPRAFKHRLRSVAVDSAAGLDRLIEAALRDKLAAAPRRRPPRRLLTTAASPSATTGSPCLVAAADAVDQDDADREAPPSVADVMADAREFLRVGVANCLAAAATSSSAAAAEPLDSAASWPAVADFVRLLALSLAPVEPGGAGPSLLALAASLRRRAPGVGLWRHLLEASGVVVGAADAAAPASSPWRWRLLHSLAAARIRTPDLPAVLPAVERLRRVCPTALPPLRPLPPPLLSQSHSATAESLTLWRLHNRARTRVFPSDRLCPGCLVAPDRDDRDALRFLLRWYRVVLELPPAAEASLSQWLPSGATAEAAEAAARPCVLRLLEAGRSDINWGRLAVLAAAACACWAALLWRIGACG